MKEVTLKSLQRFKPRHLVHQSITNKSGNAYTVRITGAIQTWKTYPDLFVVPVKYGMYDSFYITNIDDYDHRLPAKYRKLSPASNWRITK